MIIQNALNEAVTKLKKYKIKSPILDCEILLSRVLKKNREFVILNSNSYLKKNDYDHFLKLINIRAKGKPIAQITQKKFFWKNEFEISDNVLIPRPDTELLIEQVLVISKNKKYSNILEVGIGSGCVLLSILKEKKGFVGTGIDISEDCLNVSKINAYKLGLCNRLKLFKSDVDNFNNGKYDLIISNPPYIKKLKLKYLDKDIKNFEPKSALNGGLEGLSEIRKVIKKSSELIKKNGKLILEIAFDQKLQVKKLLEENGFYINKVLKDIAQNDRCIISTKINN